MNPDIARFVDYLALAYHEARNVRHLVRAGHLDRARYWLLVTGMPTNREAAWKTVAPLRQEAAKAKSAAEAEGIFERKFRVSLEELVAISEDPHWSGTQRGGNRWADIGRVLLELRSAIDQHDKNRTNELLEHLPMMYHNTGLLADKLKVLDASLSR